MCAYACMYTYMCIYMFVYSTTAFMYMKKYMYIPMEQMHGNVCVYMCMGMFTYVLIIYTHIAEKKRKHLNV